MSGADGAQPSSALKRTATAAALDRSSAAANPTQTVASPERVGPACTPKRTALGATAAPASVPAPLPSAPSANSVASTPPSERPKVCAHYERSDAYVSQRRESTTCTLLPCGVHGCTATICKDHGYGDGQEASYGEYVYDERRCLAPDCMVVYCPAHFDENTRQCDVCEERNKAEVSLGVHDLQWTFPYCRDHWSFLRECGKRIGDDGNASVTADAARSDAAAPGSQNDDADEICGWLCCDDCIDEHDWHREVDP